MDSLQAPIQQLHPDQIVGHWVTEVQRGIRRLRSEWNWACAMSSRGGWWLTVHEHEREMNTGDDGASEKK